MTTDPSRVSPCSNECHCRTIHMPQVHHRDLPEIRGEGSSDAAAASNLILQLTLALDYVSDQRRREIMQYAIADVAAYIEQGPQDPEPLTRTTHGHTTCEPG
ncbi:MAG: hypothetical protein ABI353_11685 [Isosphaeraceae bacterium]